VQPGTGAQHMSTEEITLKPLTHGNVGEVAALWDLVFRNAYLGAGVPEEDLRRRTLEADTFDHEGSFVACEGERTLGAVLSFGHRTMETDGHWHTIVPGWIGAILVRPDARRRGIGRRLLARAEDFHRERGRLLLFTGGGEGMANFFPGIEDRWEEATAFFSVCGYVFVRRTCYVDIDLAHYSHNERVRSSIKKLCEEGIRVEPATPELGRMYERYAREAQGEAPRGLPDDPGRFLVARTEDRIVGGVSHVGVREGGRAGFGSIQALMDFRNRGIGTVLLASALARCKELGGLSMPLWTRPQTADRFYLKIGFRVVREYDVYAKTLAQDLLSEEWIARHRYV